MKLVRRVIHYNRSNGGKIELGETIESVKALRVLQVIASGKDLDNGRVVRLFFQGFTRGIEITPGGPKPYTCFFDTDGDTEWARQEYNSWDCELDETNISNFDIKAYVDYKTAKDIKLMIEVELGI